VTRTKRLLNSGASRVSIASAIAVPAIAVPAIAGAVPDRICSICI